MLVVFCFIYFLFTLRLCIYFIIFLFTFLLLNLVYSDFVSSFASTFYQRYYENYGIVAFKTYGNIIVFLKEIIKVRILPKRDIQKIGKPELRHLQHWPRTV